MVPANTLREMVGGLGQLSARRLLLPDAAALHTLARSGALDSLLFADEVHLEVTDVVLMELHSSEPGSSPVCSPTHEILEFLKRHQRRIQVMETTVGNLMAGSMRESDGLGVKQSTASDLFELGIMGAVNQLLKSNSTTPTAVIIDDSWFSTNAYATPSQVKLVSASAWMAHLLRR